MVVYHGCWFANDYRLIDIDITGNSGWRAFQKSIAASFFCLVGVGLQQGHVAGIQWRRYRWRLFKIVGCATVVTTTSIFLDPNRIVTFGILHCIAACSIIALPACRLPTRACTVLATGMIAAGIWIEAEALSSPILSWVGLGTQVVPTFDHQPLLPWLGVVLLGISASTLLLSDPTSPIVRWQTHSFLGTTLALMGRWSLWLYMAHVPALVITMVVLQKLLVS